MGIFEKRRYVLVNIESKEDIFESKELLPKEVVLEDIESENLEDSLYRLEERVNGRKVRNTWVMRKPRTPKTPEELAAKSREDAEAFMSQDAQDIKERVEKHKAFADKVRQTYGIEGGGSVDKLDIPTGKDGKLTILGAFNQGIAESAYLGVRATKPAEVAESVKSVMNSGTTILAGIAAMFAEKLTNRNKPSEKKKEEPKKEAEKPKELETHKEDLGEGISKTTFGADALTDPAYQHQKIDTTYNGSDTPKESVPPVTYEQYKKDMLEFSKDEVEEEAENIEQLVER